MTVTKRKTVAPVPTRKQQTLIDAYAGNIKEAAEAVGFDYAYARKIIKKPHIQEIIHKRQVEELAPAIATRQERQRFWTTVMMDMKANMGDRLRASELLGKSYGDFYDNINVVDTTLQSLIVQVGEVERPILRAAIKQRLLELGEEERKQLGNHLETSVIDGEVVESTPGLQDVSDEFTPTITPPAPPAPPVKRKRGRPRKTQTTPVNPPSPGGPHTHSLPLQHSENGET